MGPEYVMFRYLVSVLILIAATLTWMYLRVGVPEVFEETITETSTPHLAQKPEQSIEDILIAGFYFVPKNKQSQADPNYKEIMENNLQKLVKFHKLQFQDQSNITFEIYPQPIIGQQNNLFYDTDVTQNGNPEALRSIAVELEKRAFDPTGDLYIPDFANAGNGEYLSVLIMYEGVGASGSENFALLNREFLTRDEFSDRGPTFLAHEFYHTLGLPDGYLEFKATPTALDVMGAGRFRPMERTYLSRPSLEKLGL